MTFFWNGYGQRAFWRSFLAACLPLDLPLLLEEALFIC
jgi:hypothetical protein